MKGGVTMTKHYLNKKFGVKHIDQLQVVTRLIYQKGFDPMPRIQTKSTNYEEFVEKFKPKPKLTTDDCYTPDNVYAQVVAFVASTYDVNPLSFTRPFWPGADYKTHDYEGAVVVDNPPFSCLSKIINYYNDNNIKYFLFAPALTCFTYLNKCDIVLIKPNITYHNGAQVRTAFLTNLVAPLTYNYKVLYSRELSNMIAACYPVKTRYPRTPRPANYWSAVDCLKHQQSIPRDSFISRKRNTPDGKVIFGCAAETNIYRSDEQ